MEDQDRQRLAAAEQGLAALTARLNALAEGNLELGAEGFRVGSTRLLEKLVSGAYHLHQRDAAGTESDLTGAKSIWGVPIHDISPTGGYVLVYNASTKEIEWTAASTPGAHVLATTVGLGPAHTTSGLTARQVLRATGAATAAFGAIQDADLPATIARDSELHTRLHALTDVLDHSATNWRFFYSDGSGHVIELALGADGTFLQSEGAAAAPTFGALQTTDIPDISATYQVVSEKNAVSGYAGLDAATKLTVAQIRGLRESGGQALDMGAVADGEYLKRSGTDIVGDTPAGGGGAQDVALLDGSEHNDTVAQAVTRGSLIYGNATPAWDELVKGAANTVLACDGTDPAWSGTPRLAGLKDSGGTTRIGLYAAPASMNIYLIGGIYATGTIGLGSLADPATAVKAILSYAGACYGTSLAITSTGAGNNITTVGCYGLGTSAVSGTGSSVYGLLFGGFNNATGATAAYLVGAQAQVGRNTAAETVIAELNIFKPAIPTWSCANTTVTNAYIFGMTTDLSKAQFTTCYGLFLENLANAGTNILIHAGPLASPYLRLEGGAAPTGVNSKAIVNFGGTLYRLTRNAGTGAVEAAAI